MAYTPTVWAKGDVITAVKLNKAENGIAAASAGAFYCRVSYADETWTCDKTIAQIIEAYDAGRPVYVILVQEDTDTFIGQLSLVEKTSGSEFVSFFGYQYDVSLGKPAIFNLQYALSGITITNEFVAS